MEDKTNESFENAIIGLTYFVNSALDLPTGYLDIFLYYGSFEYETLETILPKYLNNPKNIQILQGYIRVLKRITGKKIEKELPDGAMGDWVVPPEDEKKRQIIKNSISCVVEVLTKILNRYKILSTKTKYFKYKGNSQKLTAFEVELIKGQLIERTIYFREIFQGKAPDEKINWIGSASSFKYFIKKLFDTELFKEEKQIWIIAENTFTINTNPIPYNIRTYKDRDVNDKTKRIINTAVSQLID